MKSRCRWYHCARFRCRAKSINRPLFHTFALVAQDDDAASERPRLQQLEREAGAAFSKERFALSQHRWIDVDAVFVNQIEPHEGLRQRDAAEKPDIFARLPLDGVDFVTNVVFDQRGILRAVPLDAIQRARDDDFGRVLQKARML